MRRLLLTLLLVILALPFPAVAQSDPPACAPAEVTALMDEIAEFWNSAQAAQADDDLPTALDNLQRISNRVAMLRAACDGLSFSGASEMVLGPIVFPDGTYRVTATSEGYFTSHIEPMEGECEPSPQSLFNLSPEQAALGAQTVFRSAGCIALITTENIRLPWTLTFERLTISD